MTTSKDVWGGASAAQTETETSSVSPGVAIAAQLKAKTDEDVARQERQLGGDAAQGDVSGDVAAAVQAAVQALEQSLPKTLKESFALRKEIEAMTAGDKREKQIKVALLSRINRHILESQQGLPVCHAAIAADAQVHAREAQRTAHERRAARIAALKRAEQRAFAESKLTPPALEFPLSVTPREALLSARLLREQIACVRSLAISLEIYELAHYEWLNPSDGEREVREAIREAGTNQQLLGELTTKLAAMTGPEASNIRSRFATERTRLRTLFDEAARVLVAKGIEGLKGLHAQAVQAEKLWLENFNLPHEATAVSRRYTAAIAELESRQPSKTFPLPWFGINDLA